MRSWARKRFDLERMPRRAEALTHGEVKRVNGRVSKQLGNILFSRNYCDAGTVAHECVHAMMRWAERSGVEAAWKAGAGISARAEGWVGDTEEAMAYAVDAMTNQVFDELNTKGIL